MKPVKYTLAGLIIFLLTTIANAQTTPDETFEGVKKIDIPSEILQDNRTIYVHVPKQKLHEKLPVLYILDGERSNIYEEALQTIEKYPHIIVGIRTRENRERDMIPVNVSRYENSGEANVFLQFLTQELITYMNKHYSTNQHNILYGGSNAGLFTNYAMLNNPEYFHGFIASSSTIGYCKELMYSLVNELNPKTKLDGKYMYIYYGLQDPSPRVVGFIEDYNQFLMAKLGNHINIKVKELPDQGHVPAGAIREGLQFIYDK